MKGDAIEAPIFIEKRLNRKNILQIAENLIAQK